MVRNSNNIFFLILILIIGFCYSNSLRNNFVLDDEPLVVKNPLIKSPKLFPLIFKTALYEYSEKARIRFGYNSMYRPLQLLSYALDYRIWGLNPAGYHLTNIFIHALNSILVYSLFSLITVTPIAKIIAILFAVHPIHTSVVSYISSRADLLAALFMLASIIFFFKFIRLNLKRFYALSLLSAGLALICRENALTIPVFILLVLFILKPKPRKFLYCIPFILLILAYAALRSCILGAHTLVWHPEFMNFFLRIIDFLNIVPRYISLLVLPLNLHMIRLTPFILSLREPKVFLGIAFFLFYVYLIIRWRRANLLLFSLSWFIIGLIPVFFMLDGYPFFFQAMMAESWVYLASAGFFAIIAYAIYKFRKLGIIIFFILTAFYSVLTLISNTYWKHNIVVYENVLKYTSQKNPMLKNLIKEYLNQGLYLDALSAIKKFSEYYPESSDRYLLEGDYHYKTDEIDRAINSYNTALKINKYNFQIYYNLSLCYQKLKQADKSIEHALESVRLNPFYLDGLVMLGDLYSREKEYALARAYYERAFEIDPSRKDIKEKLTYAK